MMGRRTGNDVESDFDEDSVNGTNNTGWWLGPVKASLFKGRPVANPVVDFPQVPAAVELDRVVVGLAIYQITRHQGQRNTRQKVRLVDERRNPQI